MIGVYQDDSIGFFFLQELLEVFSVESSIATIKVNLNGFWRRYHVGFNLFASGTVLGNCSAEDHQTVFRHLLEEFEALRYLNDGVLNVLSGSCRFDVGSCSVLVVEHGNYFADLATRRHIKGDEFGSSAFSRGQPLQIPF